MRTPENLEVFATHGSAECPDILTPYLREQFNERLLRNFSDWGTAAIVADIPEKQRLIPRFGRLAGDPNRAPTAKTLFSPEDFGGIPIFNRSLSKSLKEQLLRLSYTPFHDKALNRLIRAHGNSNNHLLVADVHDTGNLILGETDREDEDRLTSKGWEMPAVMLGDKTGLTTSGTVMEDLANAFKVRFGLSDSDVEINTRFTGGYVTQRYGLPHDDIKEQLAEAVNPERHVVQVELGRFLYMDEKTQQLVPKAVERYRKALTTVLNEVADGLR